MPNIPALRCFAALIALLLSVSGLSVHASPWTMPSGAAAHFTYANGNDENGLFGEPLISGDTFILPTFSMVASGENGSTGSQSDTVSVDVFADPGWKFALIRVTGYGSFSASGDALVDLVPIPEPSSLALVALGLGGLLRSRSRRGFPA